MKIVSRGGTLSTEVYLKKKKRAQRKRLLIIVSIILAILVVLVLIARLEKFRIQDISVSGATVIGGDMVENFSDEVLSGYYLWVVPKDNVLLYSSSRLEKSLMKKFPRFRSVETTLGGVNTLHISVIEREPHALYCGESIIPEGAVCFFLDKSGFIFDKAPAFSDGVYFVYASEPSLENPEGRQIVPADEFDTLSSFIENLLALNIDAISLKIGRSEYDLTFRKGAHILWKEDSDIVLVYSNLETFLRSDVIKADKDFLDKIKQLDLRTDNKVFYTFK